MHLLVCIIIQGQVLPNLKAREAKIYINLKAGPGTCPHDIYFTMQPILQHILVNKTFVLQTTNESHILFIVQGDVHIAKLNNMAL